MKLVSVYFTNWDSMSTWVDFLFCFVDMTHSSSSVNLIPAAEDEAGLSVIHPEGQQTDEHKKTDMQVHR